MRSRHLCKRHTYLVMRRVEVVKVDWAELGGGARIWLTLRLGFIPGKDSICGMKKEHSL